jgi:RimJ/RimL family protein N-acetyltransferase
MVVVRPATLADLPVIHKLQNTPYREKVFTEPLPPLERFIQESEERMNAGKQYYFVFEQDSAPLGFIEYRHPEETTSIWGKWLSTLCYACAVLAFDDLNFSKLIWYTRATNKPMLRTCDKMKFRRTGETSVCYIADLFAFVAIGKLTLFELTSEEFALNRKWMKSLALPVDIRFRGSS